jgi:hypothetical protein
VNARVNARVECGLPPYPVPCAIVGVGGSAWIVDRRGCGNCGGYFDI